MADFSQYVGTVAERNFSPGYVVLSYIVSYIGSWTTLELINRRTARRGLYNWYLLIGSSISMGGIAIWCMHYIGNRAIVLSYPTYTDEVDFYQIAYSPGFTALSFFIPIFVLLAAFSAVGSHDTVSFLRLSLGGGLAGLAICGMHYLGQLGISNYSCIYQVGNVVGSAIVAVAASIAALTVFFYLQATWKNCWWKRGLTSVILAGAVSGMHWLASVGTNYELRDLSVGMGNLSRNNTVIVVIVLSVSACTILLGLTLVAQRRRSRSANRAQQVVLAAAVFDKDGRLMVTPEGLFPCRKITNSYVERSFDDIFGISHPVFLWAFRVSRNWAAISSMIPSMRSHIQHTSLRNGSRSLTKLGELELASDDGEPVEDYTFLFRELFCIAAGELADQMNEPIEKIGFLFDEILSTGQIYASKSMWKLGRENSIDLEDQGTSPILFGRGQFLFVVRKADRREAERLQGAGFRFADVNNVVDILSRSMQISSEDLTPRLRRMNDYSAESNALKPGTHLGCFVMRASIKGWFDVLVRKGIRNKLPTMQLPIQILEAWHLEFLRELNGATVSSCLKSLAEKSDIRSLAAREQLFASQLLHAIEALKDEIDDPIFLETVLIAEPVLAPCEGFDEDGKPSMAQIVAFRLIAPIHWRAPAEKLEFIPLSFFGMQQHLHKNSPGHGIFAHQIQTEFGPILNQERYSTSGRDKRKRSSLSTSTDQTAGQITEQAAQPMLLVPGSEHTRSSCRKTASLDEREVICKISDTNSEKDLVEALEAYECPKGSIDISSSSSEPRVRPSTPVPDKSPNLELTPIKNPRTGRQSSITGSLIRIGTRGEVAPEIEDQETYVDKLFAACVKSL